MKRLKPVFQLLALPRLEELYHVADSERSLSASGADARPVSVASGVEEPGWSPAPAELGLSPAPAELGPRSLAERLVETPHARAAIEDLVEGPAAARSAERGLVLADLLRFAFFASDQWRRWLATPPLVAPPAAPLAFLALDGGVPAWVQRALALPEGDLESPAREDGPHPLEAWRATSTTMRDTEARKDAAARWGAVGERYCRAGLPSLGMFFLAASRRADPENLAVALRLADMILDLGGASYVTPLIEANLRTLVDEDPNRVWWLLTAARRDLLLQNGAAARQRLDEARRLAGEGGAAPYVAVATAGERVARGLFVQALEVIESEPVVCQKWGYADRLRSLCYLCIFAERDKTYAFRGFDAAIERRPSDINLLLEASRVGARVQAVYRDWFERLVAVITRAPHFALPLTLLPAVVEDLVVAKALREDLLERQSEQQGWLAGLIGR